ncbi:MAG: NINE protein [bacterium]
MYKEVSPKNRTIALVLALLLGLFGVQRMYVGRYTSGIAILITYLVVFISATILPPIVLINMGIALFDVLCIITGRFKDKDGKLVLNWY